MDAGEGHTKVKPFLLVAALTGGLLAAAHPAAAWNEDLSPRSRIRAAHLTELQTAINNKRSDCGLGALTLTGTAAGQPVRASHIQALRTGICEVYAAAGQPPPGFCTGPAVVAGGPIRAQHITELRAATDGAPACRYACTFGVGCAPDPAGPFLSQAACDVTCPVCGAKGCEIGLGENCTNCIPDCGLCWVCNAGTCSQDPAGTFLDQPTCLGACPPACSCSWTNGGCGAGGCPPTEQLQTAACNPAGCCAGGTCDGATQCVPSAGCGGCNCTNGACGAGGCAPSERPRTCNPAGCQPEGCFADPGCGGCNPGETRSCNEGGCAGTETCQADRTWGPCNTTGLPDGTPCGESDPEAGQCCPECNPDFGQCGQCCNGTHVIPNAGSQICRHSQSDLLVCGPGGGPPPPSCIDVTCYRCPDSHSGGADQQLFCTEGGACPAGWLAASEEVTNCPCLNDIMCCGGVGCSWHNGQCDIPCNQ